MIRGDKDYTTAFKLVFNVDAEAITYVLPENKRRVVAFDVKQGKPVDHDYQAADKRIPPQVHY